MVCLFFLFSQEMYFYVPEIKETWLIKRKIYLNATLAMKHIYPKHVIICATLKFVNLLLEPHFILSYNYATFMMENYPW